MKIIDIVRFNHGVAYVVDERPEKVHEKIGVTLMYGVDETGTLYRCYEYDSPSERFKAFGGAKFDLKMRHGDATHCYGQWWDGGASKIAAHLGIELVRVTIQTIDRLKDCYVFTADLADKAKFDPLVDAFNAEHPGYTIWDYWEYKKHLNGDDDD